MNKISTINRKQISWKKIYTLMLRILMKLESYLNQKITLKNTSTKIKIDFLGFHGQTVFHNMKEKISKQLGDGKLLSKLTKKTVVYNFRKNDLVNGGEGAPLAPVFHKLLVEQNKIKAPVMILNIGGIANVTLLPPKYNNDVIGFDTGPGMSLLDEAYLKIFKDGFDHNGNVALKGNVDRDLVTTWLNQSYFIQDPPKSTGRDQFGLNWLNTYMKNIDKHNNEDILATLSYFTAQSIFLACEEFINDNNVSMLIVSGGGAHHMCTMKFLKNLFTPIQVVPSSKLNISVDSKEALGFAMLAVANVKEIPGNLPSVTGADKSVILGKMNL